MSEQEANPNTEVVRGVWRDVSVASVHDLMTAAAPFKLTELQTHVLSDRRKLPQVIEGDDWLMVQFLLPKLHHTALRQQRLVVLLGTKELVTLHTGDLPEDLVEQIVLRMYKLDSPSGVLACIADAVTDLYGPILESIDDTIDTIEDTIMRRPTEEQLQQLFTYKKLLASLRRSVLPTTSMLGALSDGRYKMIEPKFAPYLRDTNGANHDVAVDPCSAPTALQQFITEHTYKCQAKGTLAPDAAVDEAPVTTPHATDRCRGRVGRHHEAREQEERT